MRSTRARLRGAAAALCCAAALAACKDKPRQPLPGKATVHPARPGSPVVRLDLPGELAWNQSDTVLVSVTNSGAAPLAGAVLNVVVQLPVAVLVDSAAVPKPDTTRTPEGTRVSIALGDVAPGATVEHRQGIRTPPAPVAAPAPASTSGTPPGTPPGTTPAAGRPRRATPPPAAADTAPKRYLVWAWLSSAQGTPLTAPVQDTLRIRAGSEVTVGGCGNVKDLAVSRYGVGPVRIGMSPEALRAACPEARDTTWTAEGAKETGMVAVPGGQRVLAVLAGGVVQRVVTDAPGLKTAAGAGVGSTVGDLRAMYGRMCAGAGEGVVAVWFPNAPGISFGLDTTATRGWPPARTNPDSIPDEAPAGSLWVRQGSDDCPAQPAHTPGGPE